MKKPPLHKVEKASYDQDFRCASWQAYRSILALIHNRICSYRSHFQQRLLRKQSIFQPTLSSVHCILVTQYERMWLCSKGYVFFLALVGHWLEKNKLLSIAMNTCAEVKIMLATCVGGPHGQRTSSFIRACQSKA